MKTIRAFFAVLLFGPLLAGCGAASSASPATSLAESMKGYELYSWQDGNTWKFSLFTGTNRGKSLKETHIACRFTHPQELEALLHYNGIQIVRHCASWINKHFPPGVQASFRSVK